MDDQALLTGITEYLVEAWGEPVHTAWFRREDGRTCTVSKWSPDATGEGVFIYLTTGAALSQWGGAGQHRTEFFLGIDEEVDDIAPVLASVAAYRADRGAMLGHGHTVPVGGPVWRGTKMDHLLVLRQRNTVLPPAAVGDCHVEFLQVVPLYSVERDRKAEVGIDDFLDEWEARAVPFWKASREPAGAP